MTAAALPTELCLNILSHLDYYDLKCIQRVNKTLLATTQLRDFDEKLFRKSQTQPIGVSHNLTATWPPAARIMHRRFERTLILHAPSRKILRGWRVRQTSSHRKH